MSEEIIFYNFEVIRKSLGLTREQFSTKFGNERTYYSTVVIGKKGIPKLNFIYNVCNYYGVSIDDFISKKLNYVEPIGSDKE